MSEHTLTSPTTQQPPPLSAGSWKNSLRLRLLAGALIWVLAALLLTGWGLRTLFAEHLTQQLRGQLVAKLDRLSGAVNYQPDQAVPVTVSPFSGDPLLQQPLSGMYWQVDQLDAAGQQTVQAGIQRSRSLWDQTLDWPFFKADKVWEPTLPLHAPASYGHMSDGNGNTLVIVTRTVQLPEAGAPPLRLMIAADAAMLATPLQRFTKMLVAALCMLAAGLIAAVVVQLQLALAPLAALRRQLAAVSQGEASEIRGEHPAEIMPLVQEFNHVLRMNAEMVERARTQAGNLAHAVNTPLSIMATRRRSRTARWRPWCASRSPVPAARSNTTWPAPVPQQQRRSRAMACAPRWPARCTPWCTPWTSCMRRAAYASSCRGMPRNGTSRATCRT